MKHLTTEEFKEQVFDYEKNPEKWLYKGDKPMIIDFYADWCQPCKKLSPVLEEVQKENPSVEIVKVDTENEHELAEVFNIRSIPSLLFIPVEGDPQIAVGLLPKEKIQLVIDDVLLK